MQYQHIVPAVFVSRPNRFIAKVKPAGLNGEIINVHVPNTGRCRELFLPGVPVLLDKAQNPNRKTPYSLVSVYKGEQLVNIDSQAPNKLVLEALQNGSLLGFVPELIKKEATFGSSRLDFYYEDPASGKQGYIEVKGVTLELEGVAYFPDAPTERGVRHLEELCRVRELGLEAHVVFAIQMAGVREFRPNATTHPAFAEALQKAAQAGVQVLARDCLVQPGTVRLNQPVPVNLAAQAKLYFKAD